MRMNATPCPRGRGLLFYTNCDIIEKETSVSTNKIKERDQMRTLTFGIIGIAASIVCAGCGSIEKRSAWYMRNLELRHKENVAAQEKLAVEAKNWQRLQEEARQEGYELPDMTIPRPPVTGVGEADSEYAGGMGSSNRSLSSTRIYTSPPVNLGYPNFYYGRYYPSYHHNPYIQYGRWW